MEELLAVFDALRAKHEGMAAIEFNNDGTYQGGINTVRACVRACSLMTLRHEPCKGGALPVWHLRRDEGHQYGARMHAPPRIRPCPGGWMRMRRRRRWRGTR